MVECFGGHPFDFAVAEVKADHLGTIKGMATNVIAPVFISLLKNLNLPGGKSITLHREGYNSLPILSAGR